MRPLIDDERACLRDREYLCRQRRVRCRARHAQQPVAVDLVLERPHEPIVSLLEAIGLRGPELADVEHRRGAGNDSGDFGLSEAAAAQHRGERRARSDARGDQSCVAQQMDVARPRQVPASHRASLTRTHRRGRTRTRRRREPGVSGEDQDAQARFILSRWNT